MKRAHQEIIGYVVGGSIVLIFVKLSEEKRLLKDFGKSYEDYRKKVSMFIPWFPKK